MSSSQSSPSSGQFEYLTIFVHDQNGVIQLNNPIKVLFNPQQYAINKSNQFANMAIPGRDSPIIQFVRGESETLSMDLFFDTYTYDNGEDVRNYTSKVTDLMIIDPEIHAPKICSFAWNIGKKDKYFTGIIEKATTTYTMFLGNGIPVRAKLNISVRQFGEHQPIRHSPDKTKRRIFTNDPLWIIAAREYGDPEKWKEIAKANNIVDPLSIEPGRELIIPKLS
jgi:nucleoid-associated protein YgaU